MKLQLRSILTKFTTIATALGASLLTLTGCHSIETWEDDPQGNFDALWTILDEHYCFFAEKGVDWNAMRSRYGAKVRPSMTSQELFLVCADMLDELRDGHTNLSTPFEVSYYRRWWSDYPQNYDGRLIEQYYFNFNYRQVNGMTYGFLSDNVGYIYLSSFASTIGEGNLDYVLYYLQTASALIIDVRDNGGGDLDNVETIVRRFISSEMLAGYISHKTGPGHDDFSEPYPYYFRPAEEGRVRWGKPVAVLTNRSTFSAANNFVATMKQVPGVKIVGAVTGGGSGMPFSSELPNGWGVRFSACTLYDPLGEPTESGVEPTEGCAVNMDPAEAVLGHDTILDFALTLLR